MLIIHPTGYNSLQSTNLSCKFIFRHEIKVWGENKRVLCMASHSCCREALILCDSFRICSNLEQTKTLRKSVTDPYNILFRKCSLHNL